MAVLRTKTGRDLPTPDTPGAREPKRKGEMVSSRAQGVLCHARKEEERKDSACVFFFFDFPAIYVCTCFPLIGRSVGRRMFRLFYSASKPVYIELLTFRRLGYTPSRFLRLNYLSVAFL